MWWLSHRISHSRRLSPNQSQFEWVTWLEFMLQLLWLQLLIVYKPSPSRLRDSGLPRRITRVRTNQSEGDREAVWRDRSDLGTTNQTHYRQIALGPHPLPCTPSGPQPPPRHALSSGGGRNTLSLPPAPALSTFVYVTPSSGELSIS